MRFLITAGHGANDPGNTWHGVTESALMTELRFIVAMKLREDGHHVTEDGGRGHNQPLVEAIKMVSGHDVAIELHTNASTNNAAEGVEVVAARKDRVLAQQLAGAIGGVLQTPTRRDSGWFPVDQLARERGFTPGFVRAGGIIVETFFQSNPGELATYQERRWLVASAIARVLHAHAQEKARAATVQ